MQRAQEKAETAEAKVNSATNRAERQEAKRSLTAAEDAIKQAEDALAKAEQTLLLTKRNQNDRSPKMPSCRRRSQSTRRRNPDHGRASSC